ncbi:MAG: efflux RND transporter periplasmic adaptor subunit [Methylacidiphilales bacterium]|nr:efflux RND transporter periplasmic adaptor subunit [Candidatus Methylacidiphilales bacterium]
MSRATIHPGTTQVPPADAKRSGPTSLDPAQTQKRGRSRWLLLLLLLLAAIAGGYFYFHHSAAKPGAAQTASSSGKRGAGANRIEVVTADAVQGQITKYLTALGNVTPINTTTVVPQVSGQLMKVLYTEGQMVHVGDLLVQIDSRPYEAQLAQAKAQLEHDQAKLDNDKIDLQRYQTLWAQNSIPQQQLATQQALVKQDVATVGVDQSQIDAVQLNITYCNITAPIAGRVGLRLVDPGNYVQPGSSTTSTSAISSTNGLLIINQLQPITVVFPIAEDDVPALMALLKSGSQVKVEAYDRDMTKKLADGTLLATDNQIDPSTGMLSLKALFQNADNNLFPNQFVNVRVNLETKQNAILVPASAIQVSPDGDYVWIFDDDERTVSKQAVTVGATQDYKTDVLTGVDVGDTVVINGVDKLTDGMRVSVQKAQPAPSTQPAPITQP